MYFWVFVFFFLSGGEQKQFHENHNPVAMWFWQTQQWCHPRACHLDVYWPQVPTSGTSSGSGVKTSCWHSAHRPFYSSQLPSPHPTISFPPLLQDGGTQSLSFLAVFLCEMMIFHSGLLWFPSLYLVCIYYRFLFRGYPEAYLKHLTNKAVNFKLISTSFWWHIKTLPFYSPSHVLCFWCNNLYLLILCIHYEITVAIAIFFNIFIGV